ncbi:MAG: TolC family protein [Planctomycetia bacterium]|nr:TolC family protein [Planctomycetia bacterium]
MTAHLRLSVLLLLACSAAQIATGQTGPPANQSNPAAGESPRRLPMGPEVAPASPEAVTPGRVQPDPAAPPAQRPAGSLTLAELEQMALARHPALMEAAAAIEASRGAAVQAGLRPNPTIGYEGIDIGELGTAGKHGGFVSQQFITASKLQLASEVEGRHAQQREQNLATIQERVLGDVRSDFYLVVFAQRRIDVMRELARIANAISDSARKRLEVRDASAVDLLQAQTESHRTTLQLDESQFQYRAAWRRLSVLVAGGTLPPRPLVDEVPVEAPRMAFDQVLARLRTSSPELAAASAGVDKARSELQLAEAGRYPDFMVRGGVQRNFVSNNTQAEVGVSMPLQLYNRNQGAIQEAEAKLTAAEHDLARTQWNLQQRLAAAFEQYDVARVRVDKYSKDILPKDREAVRLIERGYSLGEFRYDELLLAQRTLAQANLDYIDALSQLWQSVSLMDHFLLSASLDALSDAQ